MELIYIYIYIYNKHTIYLPTCILGERSPRSFAVRSDILDEDLVLLGCPPPLLQPDLDAARSSSHGVGDN